MAKRTSKKSARKSPKKSVKKPARKSSKKSVKKSAKKTGLAALGVSRTRASKGGVTVRTGKGRAHKGETSAEEKKRLAEYRGLGSASRRSTVRLTPAQLEKQDAQYRATVRLTPAQRETVRLTEGQRETVRVHPSGTVTVTAGKIGNHMKDAGYGVQVFSARPNPSEASDTSTILGAAAVTAALAIYIKVASGY